MSHRLEIRRALYLHYSNNKVGVAGVSKLRFLELRAPKISSCYTISYGDVATPRNSPSVGSALF